MLESVAKQTSMTALMLIVDVDVVSTVLPTTAATVLALATMDLTVNKTSMNAIPRNRACTMLLA